MLVGLGIAGYLTYVHYAGLHPVCVASGGCETVQSSHYAKLAGVPVPLLGLIGYAAILGSLLVRGDTGRLATAGPLDRRLRLLALPHLPGALRHRRDLPVVRGQRGGDDGARGPVGVARAARTRRGAAYDGAAVAVRLERRLSESIARASRRTASSSSSGASTGKDRRMLGRPVGCATAAEPGVKVTPWRSASA